MTSTLGEVFTAIPISIYKPIIFLIMLGIWGNLRHSWIRTLTKVCGIASINGASGTRFNSHQALGGLVLWLLIPIFWVGLPLAMLLIFGSFFAYGVYRNRNIEDQTKRWTLSVATIKELFAERFASSKADKAQRTASVVLTSSRGEKHEVPSGDDPRLAAHQKFEDIMTFAVPRGGSRIDMAVNAQQAAMVVKIDGVRYPLPPIEAPLAVSMIDYLKTAALLDVTDRRKRQAGNVHFQSLSFGSHHLGLTTWGSTRELVMTLAIDPEEQSLLGMEQLGLLQAQIDALEPIMGENENVILVTSPPEQGQTTTLYNLVQKHDPYINSVVTLEEKVVFELEGVSHTEIDQGATPADITKRVAAMLRAEPQVLLLSRIDDGQLAQLVADSGEECRFYVGMRDEDTFGALRSWVKASGDPEMAAQYLSAIIAQRLVRRLCVQCRVPFAPDPAALQKLNLSPDRVGTLYKHSGQVLVKNRPEPCPACNGLGYRGQVGVFEVMVLDDEARSILRSGNLEVLRAYLRKNKMLWLQEAALSKVVEGVTSIQEITRALGKDANKPMKLPSHSLPEQEPAGKR